MTLRVASVAAAALALAYLAFYYCYIQVHGCRRKKQFDRRAKEEREEIMSECTLSQTKNPARCFYSCLFYFTCVVWSIVLAVMMLLLLYSQNPSAQEYTCRLECFNPLCSHPRDPRVGATESPDFDFFFVISLITLAK